VQKIIEGKIKEMDERLQDFSENGSGWMLSDILCVDITFTTLGGLRGGCSFPYPETRGLLNIQSEDDLCILYCIIAFFILTLYLPIREENQSFIKSISRI